MIVRCIAKSEEYLKPDPGSLVHYRENVHQEEVNLHIGRHYVVFGLAFRHGFPWYLICEEEDDGYPKPHFSPFFELIDDRVPPGWSFRIGSTNVGQYAILPAEWARDHSYLERLVDGESDAYAEFQSLKKRLVEWHSGAD